MLAAVLCGITLAANADTYYWIGGESGAWKSASNWSLEPNGEAAEKYPDSGINNRNTSASDTAVFDNAATVTTDGNCYIRTITLNAPVAFTGGGEFKSHYSNNNAITVNAGENGVFIMSGVKLRVGYATSKTDRGTISAPIEVAGDGNTLFLNTAYNNGARYSYLTVSGAISGTGTLEINGGSRPEYSNIVFAGSTADFTGTITSTAQTTSLNIAGWKYIAGSSYAIPSSTLTFSGNGSFAIEEGISTDFAARIKDSTSAITIDTAGNALSLGAIPASNSGGFKKTGGGTLTLTAAPLCTGTITVEEGRLVLPANATLAMDFAVAGGELEVPAGNVFTGNLDVSGNGKIVVAGNSGWDGATELFTLPAGSTLSTQQVAIEGIGRSTYEISVDETGTVSATISPATLVWNGADEAAWTSAGNWLISGEQNTYQSGDVVAFTDGAFTAAGATELTVNVDSDVAPSAVSISPSESNTYIFNGTGKVVTEDLTVDNNGAGALVLKSDVFSARSLASGNGAVTFDPGEDGEINLAAISGGGKATIASGTLNLASVPQSAIEIATGAKAVISGENASTAYMLEQKDISGAGDLYFANGVFRLRGDNYNNAHMSNFSGTLHIPAGAIYETYIRGSGIYQSHPYGTGTLALEGGTVRMPDANSQPQYTIDCAKIDVVADSTIVNNHRDKQLNITAAIEGSATLTFSSGKSSNANAYRGARLQGDNSRFSGTVNFDNSIAPGVAIGIMSNISGSALATWNVRGEPAALTHLIDLEVQTANQTMALGAFNVASANAAVYVKNPLTIALGGNDGNSTINGALALQNQGTYNIAKTGAGRLALGSGFQFANASTLGVATADYTANQQTKNIVVNEGEFTCAEGLDLGDVNITLNGGTLVFEKSSPQAGVAYTLFKTTGTINIAPAVEISAPSMTHLAGKWVLKVVNDGEYNILQISYAPVGFTIRIR
ncbi:MAG: hypothetical protein IJ802_06855 [Kiritimatiellae bacterium]|nr:hypothetical protein [Kiritimatiellia bacterium]